MSWVNKFLEDIEDPVFKSLRLMFVQHSSFYAQLFNSERKLLDKAQQYKNKQITQEEFVQWVKDNVANNESVYARIVDSYPVFRYCSLWPWYKEWWEQLSTNCNTAPKKPGRKPKN